MSLLDETYNGSASDQQQHDVSQIRSYFRGKTVFVTGATGSLGKLIVEKLLRTCNVEKVYILVREKKGKDPKDRLRELFDVPAFEPLKKQTPDFTEKVSICVGDCFEPNLGLSEEDADVLKNEVNCIFHCAATVRFDASLRQATYINVRAMRDLLNMARNMTQLSSFIHVSTAYSHCPRDDIGEKFYEPPVTEQQLMTLVESLDDETLDAVTPIILKQWPNTYVFTKAVGEDIVKTEGKGLPISICRPSMVVASSKEPIPGWIDNIYGATGLLVTIAMGLLRCAYVERSVRFDFVPVDYVVNAILAAAWNVAQRSVPVAIDDQPDPMVYNYVSGSQNPLAGATVFTLGEKYTRKVPTSKMILYYMLYVSSNVYVHVLFKFFLHIVPAYAVDFFLVCVGKKPLLVNGRKKMSKMMNATAIFRNREWNFEDTNVQILWNKLNARDRELFQFDIKGLDWDAFFQTYVLGCRLYILKDPIDTLPLGKRRVRILCAVHYFSVAIIFFLLYALLKFSFAILF